ncbi:LA_0442/LA_0875 N-terminal domain-containing protein [Leptospira kanakyensis]|uniref:LA_0442/LA_0875 N-terminal domain-containing protein n=1 Tax=Leptospira kanakyensis TaxID=2484968 RepID=UPI00223E0C7E|nr:DUF5683 domain-containing protein [Leptospira kanakyensis]MCW7471509.1 DUF5683 domain-containing protein [Leptospira kanakyensis]MCW7482240.1 DUF5683 domain-containing protein [Leptospira kanakyensis]
MKLKIKLSLFLIGNLLISGSLFPETIILKTGKTFFGRVIDQNEEILKLKENNGNILEFQKSEILKVTYKDLNTKEIKQIIEVETKKNQTSANQVTDRNEKLDLDSKKRNQTAPTTETLSPHPQKKIRWEVVTRSAVLPGLGQYHWNERVWGSVYFTAFLGAAVHYNQTWNQHKDAKEAYQNDFRSLVILSSGNSGFALNLFDKKNLAKEYRETGNAVNTASNLLIGVFLVSLIDSFLVRADKKEPSVSSNGTRPGFYLNTEMNQTHRHSLSLKEPNITSGSVEYKLGYTWVF